MLNDGGKRYDVTLSFAPITKKYKKLLDNWNMYNK